MSGELLQEWSRWTLFTALANGDDEAAAAAMTTKVGSTATFSPQPINFAEPEQSLRHPPGDAAEEVALVDALHATGGKRMRSASRHPLVAAPKMSRVAATAILRSR